MLARRGDTRRQQDQVQSIALEGSDRGIQSLREETAQAFPSLLPTLQRHRFTGEAQSQAVVTSANDLLDLDQLRRLSLIHI